jgi:hypothetical protein
MLHESCHNALHQSIAVRCIPSFIINVFGNLIPFKGISGV